jgi:Escherichia/Staphylococcus phage prohead protease
METTNFRLSIKSVSDAAGMGTFSGIASTYGNLDLQDDVVEQGAFTKSLREKNGEFPLLWQHDLRNPIGIVKARDSVRGLEVSGELVLETEKGREAYALLKKGVVRGLSIGFDIVKHAYHNTVRHLQEIRLHEISLVTIGANPAALVATVKTKESPLAESSLRELQELIRGCRESWSSNG